MLPPEVVALVEQSMTEDLVVRILRLGLPSIEVTSEIRRDQTFPVVEVRRLPTFLGFAGDPRFVESMDVAVNTLCEDPDGDLDAGLLAAACKNLLRDAWLNYFYDETLGSISYFEVLSPPRRIPDWADAAGPVQYADLPSNVWRYEGRYRFAVRKPRTSPYPLKQSANFPIVLGLSASGITS